MILSLLFFRPCHAACGILVPWPGIKNRPLAVEAHSPNPWNAREFLTVHFKEKKPDQKEHSFKEA